MVNFGPLAPEIGSLVWGTPANFNGVLVLVSLLQRPATSLNGSQPNFATCLAVWWAGEGATYIPRAAITFGIGPHSSYYYYLLLLL